MRFAKCPWIAFFFAAALGPATLVEAAPIDIGKVRIELPVPSGSVEITERLPAFRKIVESVVPEGNALIGLYAPEADVNAAAQSGVDLPHYMMAQTARAAENLDVSAADFESLAEQSKVQLPLLEDVIDGAAKDAIKKARDTLSAETRTDMDMQLGETKILGAYAQEKDWLGLSLTMRVQAAGADETATSRTLVCAANTVRVRNRLLYLFVYAQYASDADKVWTERVSRDWINATWTANRSGVAPAARTN
jgi:hypothetical protein